MIRQGSRISGLADLAGRTVMVQTGTTGDSTAQRQFGKTSPAIRRFERVQFALQAPHRGGVDAVSADNGVVTHWLVRHSGARLALFRDPGFEREHDGIAIRKGNKALLARINRGLAAIKANGSYRRCYVRYFGR
ncbi:transporter substrate-binding domain-containing protein [Chitiniphilus purpureus]|uniref:Transporter substrate-binding domain-containing protein n=1 Tax=Chitiniphilus purpureus TaxID=2981137 RepID=A0ABY6DSL1_9NEIS|nr:transporter substrate-binding domain-containing protein [Chitiniphilus sp. CD1]UXY17317.1 transporter substrate-binding domain-containing protein [Chitiniphilus sp. CD1]